MRRHRALDWRPSACAGSDMNEPPNRSRRWRSVSRPAPTLRNKLLSFAAALVLAPGLVLVMIAERSGRESLQRVIGRQLAREAGHTADRLASLIRTERQTLASFARQDLMREVRVADIDKRVSTALSTLPRCSVPASKNSVSAGDVTGTPRNDVRCSTGRSRW